MIGVFLGAGAYVWQPLDLFRSAFGPSVVSQADAGVAKGWRTIVVEPRQLRETIALVGTVAPWRTIAVTSPIESRVLAVHFRYGQKVEEGNLLVELDTSEIVAGAPSGAGRVYRCVESFRDRQGLEERARNDSRAAGVRAGPDCT